MDELSLLEKPLVRCWAKCMEFKFFRKIFFQFGVWIVINCYVEIVSLSFGVVSKRSGVYATRGHPFDAEGSTSVEVTISFGFNKSEYLVYLLNYRWFCMVSSQIWICSRIICVDDKTLRKMRLPNAINLKRLNRNSSKPRIYISIY